MTDVAQSVTIDQARSARRKIHAYIDQETRGLGADQATLIQEALGMSGLEFLERWVHYDQLPPPPALALVFAMEWVEVEPSRAVLALEPTEWMLNPSGAVHGGVTATLMDTVLGAAVQTTLPAGTGYATTDLHSRFIRAMFPDTGRVLATGTVVHAGRSHAVADARVEVEATGKLIATGTAACTIIRPS